ncbi:DEAD-box ATP-dependent RNA helicase 16-like protein [Drosera capensis]
MFCSFLVSPEETEIFEEIKAPLGEDRWGWKFYSCFSLVDSKCCGVITDVARSVTKVDVREARAQDLRNEILNSDKLKAHFQHNPRHLDLLKHDKVLSKKSSPAHLCHVPEYMFDQTTQKASKMVKLARAEMGNTNSGRPLGSKMKSRRSRNPLKTFSAEGPKRSNNRSFKKREERE